MWKQHVTVSRKFEELNNVIAQFLKRLTEKSVIGIQCMKKEKDYI